MENYLRYFDKKERRSVPSSRHTESLVTILAPDDEASIQVSDMGLTHANYAWGASPPEQYWHRFFELAVLAFSHMLSAKISIIFVRFTLYFKGAFVFLYVLLMFLFGCPMLLFELTLGQMTNGKPHRAFQLCPLLQGLGYSMMLCTLVNGVVDGLLAAIGAVYFFFSIIRVSLPWYRCVANHTSCRESLPRELPPPPYHYFENRFLKKFPAGKDTYPHTVTCMVLIWTFVFFTSIRLIRRYFRRMLIISSLPMMFMMAVFATMTLHKPGALEAVVFHFVPTYLQFCSSQVWMAAVTQCIVSLSLTNGCIIYLGARARLRPYNPRHVLLQTGMIVCKDIIIAVVFFAFFGKEAKKYDPDCKDILKAADIGLYFRVIPLIICQFPVMKIWISVFFTFFLICQIANMVIRFRWVASCAVGMMWECNKHYLKAGFITFTIYLCVGGLLLMKLSEEITSFIIDCIPSWCTYMIGILELSAGVFIYGIDNFCNDVYMILRFHPNWFYRLSWIVDIFLLMVAIVETSTGLVPFMNCPTFANTQSFISVVVFTPVFIAAVYNTRIFFLKGKISSLLQQKNFIITDETNIL